MSRLLPYIGVTNLSKLQVLQTKALWIVTDTPKSNYENMYRYKAITNLDSINTYLVGKFMHKIYHQEVLDIDYDLFIYNCHIHDHYTGVFSHLHVPLANTNPSKTGIRYQWVIVRNIKLTADINPDCSELSFKLMYQKSIDLNPS